MVTVRMTEETYALIREQVATIFEGQMLNGCVTEWNEFNEKALRALLELNSQHIQYDKVEQRLYC
jgi:hypothetical protein